MTTRITYKAFFRCEFPVEVERKDYVWTITKEFCGIAGHIYAQRAGEHHKHEIVGRCIHNVEYALEHGIEIEPNTIRFELFQILAAQGKVEIKETRSEYDETFDVRKYISRATLREGWGRSGRH